MPSTFPCRARSLLVLVAATAALGSGFGASTALAEPPSSAAYEHLYVDNAADEHRALMNISVIASFTGGALSNGDALSTAAVHVHLLSVAALGGGAALLGPNGSVAPFVSLRLSLLDVDDVSVYLTMDFGIDTSHSGSSRFVLGGGVSVPVLRDLFVRLESGYVGPDGAVSITAGVAYRFLYYGEV